MGLGHNQIKGGPEKKDTLYKSSHLQLLFPGRAHERRHQGEAREAGRPVLPRGHQEDRQVFNLWESQIFLIQHLKGNHMNTEPLFHIVTESNGL